jgi:hypothetical protein
MVNQVEEDGQSRLLKPRKQSASYHFPSLRLGYFGHNSDTTLLRLPFLGGAL